MSGANVRGRGFGPRGVHPNCGFGTPRFPHPNFNAPRPPPNRLGQKNWLEPPTRAFPAWQLNTNFSQRPLFRPNAPRFRPPCRGRGMNARGIVRFSGCASSFPFGPNRNTNRRRMPLVQSIPKQVIQDEPIIQLPPPGSEEERQQKITETADKLKQMLSCNSKEETINYWEDNFNPSFSVERVDESPSGKGISELQPLELNLTFNDFRDIGRVDCDTSKNNTEDDVSIISVVNNSTSKLAELEVLATNDSDLSKDVENDVCFITATYQTNDRDCTNVSISEQQREDHLHSNLVQLIPNENVESTTPLLIEPLQQEQQDAYEPNNLLLENRNLEVEDIAEVNDSQNQNTKNNKCIETTVSPTNASIDYVVLEKTYEKKRIPEASLDVQSSGISDLHLITYTRHKSTNTNLKDCQEVSNKIHFQSKNFNMAHACRPMGPQCRWPVPQAESKSFVRMQPTPLTLNDHVEPPEDIESSPQSGIKDTRSNRVEQNGVETYSHKNSTHSQVDQLLHKSSTLSSKPISKNETSATKDTLQNLSHSNLNARVSLPNSPEDPDEILKALPNFDPSAPPPHIAKVNEYVCKELNNIPGFNPQQPPPMLPNQENNMQPLPIFHQQISQEQTQFLSHTSMSSAGQTVVNLNLMDSPPITDFNICNYPQLSTINLVPPQSFISGIQMNFSSVLPQVSCGQIVSHEYSLSLQQSIQANKEEVKISGTKQTVENINGNEQQNISMEEGLEDMQEAMEFAKQVMSMTDRAKEIVNLTVPVYPTESFSEPVKSKLNTSESVRSSSSSLKQTYRKTSTKLNIQGTSSETEHNIVYGPQPRHYEINACSPEDQNREDGNESQPEEDLLTEDLTRPKVVFNLNSTLKKINKQEDWQHRLDGAKPKKQKPVVDSPRVTDSLDLSLSSEDPRKSQKLHLKKCIDNKQNVFIKNTQQHKPQRISGSFKRHSHRRSTARKPDRTPTYKAHSCQVLKQSIKSPVKDKIQKLQENEISAPNAESSWKRRVINGFLKMSKNDIRNMVNHSSLRKFDIAMQHLVKEQKSSLSLEMRNAENEKMKEYNREEFMHQLNAMLDPSATVDITNLPTAFIHHLSEVLQLDPKPSTQHESVARFDGNINTPDMHDRDILEMDPVEQPQSDSINHNNNSLKRTEHQHCTKAQNTKKNSVSTVDINIRDNKGSTNLPDIFTNESMLSHINQPSTHVDTSALENQTNKPSFTSDRRNRHQSLFNLSDLDDIFSSVLAKTKEMSCASQHKEAENSILNVNNSSSSVNSHSATTNCKSLNLQASTKNVLDVDDITSIINRGRNRSRKCLSEDQFSLRSEKCERWSRRGREDPDTFRNLTREEWEAKYGQAIGNATQHEVPMSRLKSRVNSSEDRCYNEKYKRNYSPHRYYSSDSPSRHTSISPPNVRIFNEYERGSSKEKSNETSMTNSDASNSSTSDSSTNALANVTKLLKMIKEKEKIAKTRSLNETIRDEVAAEIELKRKERNKQKGHKTRKHYRRRKERREKRRRDRRKKRKKSTLGTDSDSDNNIKQLKLLTNTEIKQEVVIKEETNLNFKEEDTCKNDNTEGSNKKKSLTSNVEENAEDCISHNTVMEFQNTQTNNPAAYTKTKAQLKEMPECLDKSAKIQDNNASENITDNTKDMLHTEDYHTPIAKEEQNQCDDKINSAKKNSNSQDNVTDFQSIQSATNGKLEARVACLNVNTCVKEKPLCKKIDIKEYKARALQKKLKEQENAKNVVGSNEALHLWNQSAINETKEEENKNTPSVENTHTEQITKNSNFNYTNDLLFKLGELPENESNKQLVQQKDKVKPDKSMLHNKGDSITDGKFKNIRSEGSKEMKLKKVITKKKKDIGAKTSLSKLMKKQILKCTPIVKIEASAKVAAEMAKKPANPNYESQTSTNSNCHNNTELLQDSNNELNDSQEDKYSITNICMQLTNTIVKTLDKDDNNIPETVEPEYLNVHSATISDIPEVVLHEKNSRNIKTYKIVSNMEHDIQQNDQLSANIVHDNSKKVTNLAPDTSCSTGEIPQAVEEIATNVPETLISSSNPQVPSKKHCAEERAQDNTTYSDRETLNTNNEKLLSTNDVHQTLLCAENSVDTSISIYDLADNKTCTTFSTEDKLQIDKTGNQESEVQSDNKSASSNNVLSLNTFSEEPSDIEQGTETIVNKGVSRPGSPFKGFVEENVKSEDNRSVQLLNLEIEKVHASCENQVLDTQHIWVQIPCDNNEMVSEGANVNIDISSNQEKIASPNIVEPDTTVSAYNTDNKIEYVNDSQVSNTVPLDSSPQVNFSPEINNTCTVKNNKSDVLGSFEHTVSDGNARIDTHSNIIKETSEQCEQIIINLDAPILDANMNIGNSQEKVDTLDFISCQQVLSKMEKICQPVQKCVDSDTRYQTECTVLNKYMKDLRTEVQIVDSQNICPVDLLLENSIDATHSHNTIVVTASNNTAREAEFCVEPSDVKVQTGQNDSQATGRTSTHVNDTVLFSEKLHKRSVKDLIQKLPVPTKAELKVSKENSSNIKSNYADDLELPSKNHLARVANVSKNDVSNSPSYISVNLLQSMSPAEKESYDNNDNSAIKSLNEGKIGCSINCKSSSCSVNNIVPLSIHTTNTFFIRDIKSEKPGTDVRKTTQANNNNSTMEVQDLNWLNNAASKEESGKHNVECTTNIALNNAQKTTKKGEKQILHRIQKQEMKRMAQKKNRSLDKIVKQTIKAGSSKKEVIMARMMEIDVEIHKLMSEKMTLYQMLESSSKSSEKHKADDNTFSNRRQEQNAPSKSRMSSVLNNFSQRMQNVNISAEQNLDCSTKFANVKDKTSSTSGSSDEEDVTQQIGQGQSQIYDKGTKQKGEIVISWTDDNMPINDTPQEQELRHIYGKRANNPTKENGRTSQQIQERECTDSLNFHTAINRQSCSNLEASILHPDRNKSNNINNDFVINTQDRPQDNKILHDQSNNEETTQQRRNVINLGIQDFHPPEAPKAFEKFQIYSDESTWESAMHNSLDTSQQRKSNTGLALLEEIYKQDMANSRKVKTETRKKKKKPLQHLLENATTSGFAEISANHYTAKQNQHHCLDHRIDGSNTEFSETYNNSLSEDNVQEDLSIWKDLVEAHVEEVINAVAENRIHDLYTQTAVTENTINNKTISATMSPTRDKQVDYLNHEIITKHTAISNTELSTAEITGEELHSVQTKYTNVESKFLEQFIPQVEREVQDNTKSSKHNFMKDNIAKSENITVQLVQEIAKNFHTEQCDKSVELNKNNSSDKHKIDKLLETDSNMKVGTTIMNEIVQGQSVQRMQQEPTLCDRTKEELRSNFKMSEDSCQLTKNIDGPAQLSPAVNCENIIEHSQIESFVAYDSDNSGTHMAPMLQPETDSTTVSDDTQNPATEKALNTSSKKFSKRKRSNAYTAVRRSSRYTEESTKRSKHSYRSKSGTPTFPKKEVENIPLTTQKNQELHRSQNIYHKVECLYNDMRTPLSNEQCTNVKNSLDCLVTYAQSILSKPNTLENSRKRKKHTKSQMISCKVVLVDCKDMLLGPDIRPDVLRNLGIRSINTYSWPIKTSKDSNSELQQNQMQITPLKRTQPMKSTDSPVYAPESRNAADENQITEETQSSSTAINDALKANIPSNLQKSNILIEQGQHVHCKSPRENVCVETIESFTLKESHHEQNKAPEIVEERKLIAKDCHRNDERLVLDSTETVNEKEQPRMQYTVHKGPILDIKVFGDSFLAASEDGTIYRYSQASNGILNIYKGHKSAVTCLYIHKTDNSANDCLYSGSLDGSLRCYNIMTGIELKDAATGSPVQCIDHAWGIIFIGTKSGHVPRFHIKAGVIRGENIQFSDKSVLALKATNEASRRVLIIASRSQPITIRDAQTGLFLRTICGQANHTVYSLMRDNNLIYCGTSSTSIPVFDFTTGEQVMQYRAGVGIVCMQIYRQWLFAGCYDGNIYVFDTKDCKLVSSIPGPGNMLLSMEIMDNKIIAGSKDKRLQLWQMPKQVRSLLHKIV